MQFLEMNMFVQGRFQNCGEVGSPHDFLHLNNNLSANWKVYNGDMKKLVWLQIFSLSPFRELYEVVYI